MPYRLGEGRTKIQFVTASCMPALIYGAAKATDVPSNTRYIQEAVCEKLARDLDIPLENLLSELPPPKGPAAFLHDGTRHSQPRAAQVAQGD